MIAIVQAWNTAGWCATTQTGAGELSLYVPLLSSGDYVQFCDIGRRRGDPEKPVDVLLPDSGTERERLRSLVARLAQRVQAANPGGEDPMLREAAAVLGEEVRT